MQKFIDLLKSNPKKAILVLIVLLVYAVGSYFITGCAFHLSGADNITGFVRPLELEQ